MNRAAARLVHAVVLGLVSQSALSQDAKPDVPKSYIRPVLLDKDDSSGATLGLDYLVTAARFWGRKITFDPGGEHFPKGVQNAASAQGVASVLARGTLVGSSAKAANKLLDFSVNASYRINTLPAFYEAGLVLAYETDQSRDNRQGMAALALAASKMKIFTVNDVGNITAIYGTVDPSADTARRAVDQSLDHYRRLNVELGYSYTLLTRYLSSIDFNVRYYKEQGAPAAVKLADLDEQLFGLIRVNLHDGFFIQYSAGKLPFDQKSVRTVKFGWSLQLM